MNELEITQKEIRRLHSVCRTKDEAIKKAIDCMNLLIKYETDLQWRETMNQKTYKATSGNVDFHQDILIANMSKLVNELKEYLG
jgi:hypothetical protein